MASRHHYGLRVRAALAWATGALLLSVTLSVVAYQLVRTQLVEDRQDRATAQAYVNARALRNALRTSDPDLNLNTVLGSLSTNARSTILAFVDGSWFAGSVGTGPTLLPTALQEVVAEGDAGSQIADVDGVPSVVVGVPVSEAGAQYYELVSLEDVDVALTRLARGLSVAAIAATIAAAVAGWYVSRQILRPVRTMSVAASRIAEGHLDARLDAFGDPELQPLQSSFNDMADKVQERIERERRFASDVSHELRTPLTAMLSSIQIARRRMDDPVAIENALADLEDRGDAFRTLVVDLLEISRLDAGVAEFVPEPIVPEELVGAVLVGTGHTDVPVRVEAGAPTVIEGDKRRLGQVLQNLLENADRHGGGPTCVTIAGTTDTEGSGRASATNLGSGNGTGTSGGDKHRADAGRVAIAVDDEGPGVAEHERTHIFNRFARGQSGALSTEGSGLGLALVAEHVRLHGGTITVGDAPGGGARFTIFLPVRRATSTPA